MEIKPGFVYTSNHKDAAYSFVIHSYDECTAQVRMSYLNDLNEILVCDSETIFMHCSYFKYKPSMSATLKYLWDNL